MDEFTHLDDAEFLNAVPHDFAENEARVLQNRISSTIDTMSVKQLKIELMDVTGTVLELAKLIDEQANIFRTV